MWPQGSRRSSAESSAAATARRGDRSDRRTATATATKATYRPTRESRHRYADGQHGPRVCTCGCVGRREGWRQREKGEEVSKKWGRMRKKGRRGRGRTKKKKKKKNKRKVKRKKRVGRRAAAVAADGTSVEMRGREWRRRHSCCCRRCRLWLHRTRQRTLVPLVGQSARPIHGLASPIATTAATATTEAPLDRRAPKRGADGDAGPMAAALSMPAALSSVPSAPIGGPRRSPADRRRTVAIAQRRRRRGRRRR